ncbi:arylsulfatase [Halieaceae bacterium IMCC8485]|uniref:Arylsulfatase n=1 Tax=Candidatus Seongchinamella marina TaxID=2518990 RepID=A0ABT3SYF6_9GAMM|nr:arylsulfatase [Candidatus Seongchinamella marina]MCX2975003.1 arylsulfatase [Candidatus Seongchinamella marina]
MDVAVDTVQQPSPPTGRPNIVFILADDLGYTDIASYGSEVHTPSLSALAEQGLSFTNYHTAANCAPARAMLLTGVDSHLAGVPNIPEMLAPEQRVHANYQGVLGDDVVTVATLLEDAGYHTYMAGKWHLGMEPHKRPSRRGFQRTMAMMDSGADHWEQRPYIALYDQANWFADGERFTLPEDFYSSRFLVDKMIEFIDSNLQDSNSEDNRPFFAYLPFMAVHSPVQAPQLYIDRYMDVYDSGWDALRQQRLERAAALGIVPPETPMVRMATTGDWDALSQDDRRYQAKRMAVYAGMIEAMDFHIGRLIEFLKQRGQYENTIFIFTSDNGSEASGPADPRAFPVRLVPESIGYNVDYENLGLKGSYSSLGPGFASASASPLAYYKFYAGEGGMRVPLIIAGKPVVSPQPQQQLTRAFAWATDISPTILSLAGVAQPGQRYAGRPVQPMTGRDLTPLITGAAERVYGSDDAVGYELTDHGVLFQGDYKLVINQPPVGDGQWRLFNTVEDPGETIDLSASQALRFQRMLSRYEQYLQDNKVVPVPQGYNQMAQLLSNILLKQRDDVLVFLLTLLLLLPFYVAYRMKNPG